MGRGKHLSQEEREEVVRQALEGTLYKIIAHNFGIAESAISKIAVSYGIYRRMPPKTRLIRDRKKLMLGPEVQVAKNKITYRARKTPHRRQEKSAKSTSQLVPPVCE